MGDREAAEGWCAIPILSLTEVRKNLFYYLYSITSK